MSGEKLVGVLTGSRDAMAPARVLLLLASGFLWLGHTASFHPPLASAPACIRRAAICRMWPVGSGEQGAGLSPLAREAIQMGVSLPVLLAMLQRQRAAAKPTGSRSCEAERRRQAHRELKKAAMRSSSIACNAYFRIIHEDYCDTEMPRGDGHCLGAHEKLEARRRGGRRTALDPGKTQTLRRGLLGSSYAPRLATQWQRPSGAGSYAGTITVSR